MCGLGTSKVWGVHFLNRETESTPGDGGAGEWDDPTDDDPSVKLQFVDPTDDSGDEETVFGVTLAQQPSCSTNVVGTSDPYLGYGSHTTISQWLAATEINVPASSS